MMYTIKSGKECIKKYAAKKPAEHRSCVKVEAAVLGSLSLISLMVSVDVKQHCTQTLRAQELCESRGGRPGLPVPDKPYGFCGRKATWKKKKRNREDRYGLQSPDPEERSTYFLF